MKEEGKEERSPECSGLMGVDSHFSHNLVVHPPASLRGTVSWRVESLHGRRSQLNDSKTMLYWLPARPLV